MGLSEQWLTSKVRSPLEDAALLRLRKKAGKLPAEEATEPGDLADAGATAPPPERRGRRNSLVRRRSVVDAGPPLLEPDEPAPPPVGNTSSPRSRRTRSPGARPKKPSGSAGRRRGAGKGLPDK